MTEYAKQKFPEQPTPIYDFYVDNQGKLHCTEYYNYTRSDTITHIRIKFQYRIHTGARIITKTSLQMDKYLNGHLFTLENDPQKALSVIKQSYEQKIKAAKKALKKYTQEYEKICGSEKFQKPT